MSPAARRGANGNGQDLSLRIWAEEAEAAAGIARALAGTPFVPEQLRRYTNPDEKDPRKKVLDLDGTVATVTAVLLAGQELGLGPMASLRSITIIKGTVALYALAARALLQHHGHEIVVVESTSSRAIVRARRGDGDGDWQTSTWDIQRATAAKLFPGHEYGNWRTQTKSMLVARATAEASRWVAADAMLGLPVMVEELDEDGQLTREHTPAEIEGPPAEGTKPAATGRTSRRRNAPARRALPSAPPPGPPEQPPDIPPEPPAPVTPKATSRQRNRIHAQLRDLGISDKDEALGMISVWVHHPVESTGHLTPEDAVTVIERMDALLKAAQPPDVPPGQPSDPEPPEAAEPDPPEPEGDPPDAEPD